MKRLIYLAPVWGVLASLAVPLQASVNWTSAPVLIPERIKGADRRTQSAFRPHNMSNVLMQDFPSSKGESIANELNAIGDGSFSIKIGDKIQGNYHWLTAADSEGLHFASTVHYFSSPGPAPRQMLKQNKLPLEIKPVNLPREHQRFRANENWDFIVLSQGKPLADASVALDTSNGTTTTMTSDANGIVSVSFPDDFAAFAEKHKGHDMGHASHGRKSAQFALSVEHDNKTSAFNYKYGEDAFTNKSVLPAIGLAFSGSLITGIFLFRRRSA